MQHPGGCADMPGVRQPKIGGFCTPDIRRRLNGPGSLAQPSPSHCRSRIGTAHGRQPLHLHDCNVWRPRAGASARQSPPLLLQDPPATAAPLLPRDLVPSPLRCAALCVGRLAGLQEMPSQRAAGCRQRSGFRMSESLEAHRCLLMSRWCRPNRSRRLPAGWRARSAEICRSRRPAAARLSEPARAIGSRQ